MALPLSTVLLVLGAGWVYSGTELYGFPALLSLIYTKEDDIWYETLYVWGDISCGPGNFCCLGKLINLRP